MKHELSQEIVTVTVTVTVTSLSYQGVKFSQEDLPHLTESPGFWDGSSAAIYLCYVLYSCDILEVNVVIDIFCSTLCCTVHLLQLTY